MEDNSSLSLLDILAPNFPHSNDINDPTSEFNPDILSLSPYMTINDIITKVHANPDTFSILSLNCQSLSAKFSELTILLQILAEKKRFSECLVSTRDMA